MIVLKWSSDEFECRVEVKIEELF